MLILSLLEISLIRLGIIVMLDHAICIKMTTFVFSQNYKWLDGAFFVCLLGGLLEQLKYKFIALFSMTDYMLHLGFSLPHCTD